MAVADQSAGRANSKSRRRTLGRFAVFHDGVAVTALSGATAETKGPGDNKHTGNNRCVEAAPTIFLLKLARNT